MTWPERLSLLQAILAQVPWSWVIASLIVGVVLGITLVTLAALVVLSNDSQRRDIYYENYIRSNHRK